MAKLFIVRHGQSQWNLENRFTGWKDVDLTELGKREAFQAAQTLRDEEIDIAFTSKLVRAQNTLKIILDEIGGSNIPITVNKALNERSYGNLEGFNKEETALKFGHEKVHIWRRSFDVPPPGGESLEQVCARVSPYFEKQIKPKLKQDKNVLIVAHGNSLRALIMHLENISPKNISKIEIATGESLKYVFDEQMNITRLT